MSCCDTRQNGRVASGGVASFFAPWTVLREVDFSLWAATDFAAGGDGVYALDGGSGSLNWTISSSANANAGLATGGFFRRNNADLGDDGVTGLRIFHDQNVTTTLSRAAQTSPRVQISLATLIPGFDPTRQYRFELEVTRFDDNGLVFGTQSAAVMALFGAAGSPAGSTARLSGIVLQRFAADDANPGVLAGNDTRLPITSETYQGSNANVLAIQVDASQQVAAFAGSFGTDWPASSTLVALGSASEAMDNNAANSILGGEVVLEIGNESRANQTGSIDIMFRRVRVLGA